MSRAIKLSIETEDRSVLWDVLGEVEDHGWLSKAEGAPDGVEVRVASGLATKAAGVSEVIDVVIAYADDVDVSVVADWLWRRMTRDGAERERIRSLRTGRREVIVDAPGIAAAIREESELVETDAQGNPAAM
jgi:hypothetical protein